LERERKFDGRFETSVGTKGFKEKGIQISKKTIKILNSEKEGGEKGEKE